MMRFIELQLLEKGLENLIPSHGNILTNLYDYNRKMTMKEIAKRIGKDKSTVTPLVNKLEKLGYVKKEKSETDRRTSYLSLSAKGEEMEQQFRIISDEVVTTAYKGFTEEEKSELLRLLKKLNNNFHEDK